MNGKIIQNNIKRDKNVSLSYKQKLFFVFVQVVAQGNIVIGDEVEMTSKQKTFAVALSREMVPTARIVVYFIRHPEEIVTDVLNFFVNGTRQNEVCLHVVY